MWRNCYLLLALLILSVVSVAAQDVPAEKLKPKRELTEGQKKLEKELKSKIAEELKRLAQVRQPLTEIEKELKGPEKELSLISGMVSKISTITNDNEALKPDSKEAKAIEGKIIDEAKKVSGAGAFAKQAIENFKITLKLNEAEKEKKDKDIKKFKAQLDSIKGKMDKAKDKLDGKLRKTVEKLDEKKREEQDKFKAEKVALETYRAKLKSIYGYEVDNAAVLFADDSNSDAQVTVWLDEQGRFIERLSAFGYDDLADMYFDRIRKANNPYTGKPLADNARNYMNKIGAKLKLQKAQFVGDIKQKILLGEEAVGILELVVSRLIPNSPSHMDATIELLHAKFALADSVARAAKTASFLIGDFPYATKLPVTGGDDKKDDKKKDDKKASKKASDKLTAKSLDELKPEQLLAKAVEWSNLQFKEGVDIGLDLHEKISGIFMDMIDSYLAARNDGKKLQEQKYFRLLNSFSPRKLKTQHALEKAFGDWMQIFTPEASARNEIGAQANGYISDILDDYRQIWPGDKYVYVNWITINGEMLEPVLEKGEDGKPLPHFIKDEDSVWKEMSKEEKQYELHNLERYPWASDRAEDIFNWYLVGKDKGIALKDASIQANRERGFCAYVEALANLTVNTYLRAQSAKGAGDKAKLKEFADKLRLKAIKAVQTLGGGSTPVGAISDAIKQKALLQVATNFYVMIAKIELKAGNKDKAAEYSASALASAAMGKTLASGYYSRMADELIVLVGDFNKANNIAGSDDPASWPAALLATKADDFLIQGVKAESAGDSKLAKQNFEKSRDLYVIMLDKYRGLKGKDEREASLVKALYNSGVAFSKLGDYLSAIIVNQALVQEFRNDFKNPDKNYPPKKYDNVERYFDKALNNLRAAADKQRVRSGTVRDKRNYVDALLMNVRSSEKGEDYVALVDQFKRMGDYASAVEFIDNVPVENDYYRIIQLMASSIYLEMIKQDVEEIKDIDASLNPEKDEDGNIPEDKKISEAQKQKLLARKQELKKSIKASNLKADEYAKKFIALHTAALEKWEADRKLGIKISDAVEKIRNQERENLLKAMLIPISMAFESQDWDDVIRLVPAYYKAVNDKKGVSDKDKRFYLVTASYLLFIAQFNKADYKKDSLDKCIANLKTTEKIQEQLAKYDVENTRISSVAAILGSAWLQLSSRSEKEKKADLTRELSLNAVNWLDKAERRIYENVNLGITMGATLTEQKLYGRAESTLQKVIQFWGESLFTPMSLFQDGKNASNMDAMSPAIASNLGGAFDAGKISAAKSDPAKLSEALDKMIVGVKFEDNAEGFNKAITAITKEYANDKFKHSAEQAAKIAASFAEPSADAQKLLKLRPYLNDKPSEQQRNRLNRIMLEAAYPQALFRQEVTPIVPAPSVTLQQTYVLSRAYRSEAGRKKSAVLMAMFDPKSVENSSYGEVVFGRRDQKGKGGFVAEINKLMAETKSVGKKELYSRILETLENPVVVTLYGVPNKRGRLEGRNYFQTVKSIETIRMYDSEFPTSEKLPIDDYLKDLDKALKFQNIILYAKKNYAKAMVENGQYVKAEKYVRELSVLFPADWTLTLDLGRVYTEMAKYEGGKDSSMERVRRPYSKESAAEYILGIMQINTVLRIAPPGTEPFWKAKLLILDNGISSLEARKKASADLQGEFVVTVDYFSQATGETKKIQQKIDSLDKVGRALVIDALRTKEMVNPPPPANVMSALKKMLERLDKIGFAPPKEASLDAL